MTAVHRGPPVAPGEPTTVPVRPSKWARATGRSLRERRRYGAPPAPTRSAHGPSATGRRRRGEARYVP